MKLSDHFSKQFVKAGVDVTTDAAKAFLEAMGTVTTEIPDDMATGIDNRFITIDAAKNNHPDIKFHYTKQALDTIEKTYGPALDELQIPQDLRDQINQEQSTFKRVPLFMKAIKELESKKANATKPEMAKITEQIDTLNAQLRAEKETTKKIQDEFAQKEKDMRISNVWTRMIGNQKTVFDHLDPDLKADAIMTMINKNLQLTNGKVDFDDNGNFVLLKKDGMNYFDSSNTPMNPQQFFDGLLSRNKILVTTATPPQGQGATPPTAVPPTNPRSGNGDRGGNGAPSATVQNIYKEHREKALADLKNQQ